MKRDNSDFVLSFLTFDYTRRLYKYFVSGYFNSFWKCLYTHQFTRLQRKAVVMADSDLYRPLRPHNDQGQMPLVLL